LFQIGEAIKTNRSLHHLNIGNHTLKKEDAALRNNITDRGARVMAQVILENVGLKKLVMNNCARMTNDGAHSLMKAVRSGVNRSLTDLYLENSLGVSVEKRDELRQGNKNSNAKEEGSLLTASAQDDAEDARLGME